MALSSSDLVQRVRDLVMDRAWETSSTTTGTGTTVAVPDGTQWSEGDIGEWQTGAVGGEQFYVRSVSSNDLTVFRGYNGTTAETHTSGDRILKNPQYTIRQIQQAVDKAVRSLWPSVYKVGTITLSGYASTTIWHNLNAATVGIVGVVQLYGSSDQYAGLFGTRGSLPFQTNFGLPAALVSSGKGLRFPSGLYHATNDIVVSDMRLVTGTTDAVKEIEAVTLAGYSGTDEFKLTWNAVESAAIVRGTNNTAAGIKTAIEGISGFVGTVTVSGVTDDGFLVTWDTPGDLTFTLSVTSGTGGTTGDVAVVQTGATAATAGDIDNTLFPVDECLVYLAAGNLLQALEIRRVSRGEEADTVGSVSTGTRLQTGAWYTNMGNTKKEELKLKMEEYYSPIRMRR